jgi:hypothetical protein
MNGIFNATRVTAFPVVPNPAPGTIYFGVDNVDGHFKVQDSAGVVTDYQSGASYSDPDAIAAINAAILASSELIDPNVDDIVYIYDSIAASYKKIKRINLLKRKVDRFFSLFSDFMGSINGEFTQYISGTGASVQNGTYGQDAINNALGVTQVDTGTTATGRAGLATVTGAILSPTLARLTYEARHALEAISTITDTFIVRCGLGDFFTLGTDGNNGLFFSYTDLVNGGKWLAVSRVAGVTVTAVDTGRSPDLDYHLYRVDLNEAGTIARFYIDDILVATINSPNLPGIANKMGAGFQIVKTAGLTQRNFSTDHMLIQVERSVAR